MGGCKASIVGSFTEGVPPRHAAVAQRRVTHSVLTRGTGLAPLTLGAALTRGPGFTGRPLLAVTVGTHGTCQQKVTEMVRVMIAFSAEYKTTCLSVPERDATDPTCTLTACMYKTPANGSISRLNDYI